MRPGGNDQIDVRPCNSSETLQLWVTNATAGTVSSAATLAALRSVLPSFAAGGSRGLDVNNHQTDPGTTLQLGDAAVWKRVTPPLAAKTSRSAAAADFQIASESYGGGSSCVWHTPLPPPPPAPPPPAPRPACDGACVVVTHATIEVLRVNQPWGPTEPRPLTDGVTGAALPFPSDGSSRVPRVLLTAAGLL